MSTLSAEPEKKPIPEDWQAFAAAVTNDSTRSFSQALSKCGKQAAWFYRQQDDPDFRVYMADVIGKRALYRRLQCEFMWNELFREKKVNQLRMAQLRYFLGRWDPGQVETQELQAIVNVNPADTNSTRVAVALLLKRAGKVRDDIEPLAEEF